jgi:hypothetical protein
MQAMSEAFDQTCDVLGTFGKRVTVSEIIARRIVEAATMGERDPTRLYRQALNAMGIDEQSAHQLAT